MPKFAKLFDVEDSQVLYTLTADGGMPVIKVLTSVDGLELTGVIDYKHLDPEKMWGVAEHMFEKLGYESALNHYQDMRLQFGDIGEAIQ